MASHHQHSAEIFVFPPKDYPDNSVQPIPEEHLARIMGEPIDCFQAFEDAQLECEAIARRLRHKAIIEWLCLAAVLFSTAYFCWQLLGRPGL